MPAKVSVQEVQHWLVYNFLKCELLKIFLWKNWRGIKNVAWYFWSYNSFIVDTHTEIELCSELHMSRLYMYNIHCIKTIFLHFGRVSNYYTYIVKYSCSKLDQNKIELTQFFLLNYKQQYFGTMYLGSQITCQQSKPFTERKMRKADTFDYHKWLRNWKLWKQKRKF